MRRKLPLLAVVLLVLFVLSAALYGGWARRTNLTQTFDSRTLNSTTSNAASLVPGEVRGAEKAPARPGLSLGPAPESESIAGVALPTPAYAAPGGASAPASGPAPGIASAASGGAPSTGSVADAAPLSSGGGSGYQPSPPQPIDPGTVQQQPMTAGKVDDNAAFSDYLDYLNRNSYLPVHPVDVRQRLFVRVVDNSQHPVAGANVTLFDGDKEVFSGETVSDGSVLFFPNAAGAQQAQNFRAVVSRGQAKTEVLNISPGAGRAEVVLKGATDNTGPVSLDLVFLLDSTGSMQDEIDRIKATVGTIASRIEQLPGSTKPRFGLVTFRDQGDDYVTRSWDLTGDINEFSANLAPLEARGGGDQPESVNAGLHEAIHLPGWADNSAGRHIRMIVLVGDAPPHLDYPNDYEYTALLREATAMGIKVFPIGASGLDDQGEYIFRQFAQITEGQFVFLTYANGVSGAPGVSTTHQVSNYTVSDLDSLVVSLVAGEIANQEGRKAGDSQGQVAPVPAIAPVEPALPSEGLPGLITALASAANRWLAQGTAWLVVLGLPLIYLAAWRKRRSGERDLQSGSSSVDFRLSPDNESTMARLEQYAQDGPAGPFADELDDLDMPGSAEHQNTVALPALSGKGIYVTRERY